MKSAISLGEQKGFMLQNLRHSKCISAVGRDVAEYFPMVGMPHMFLSERLLYADSVVALIYICIEPPRIERVIYYAVSWTVINSSHKFNLLKDILELKHKRLN